MIRSKAMLVVCLCLCGQTPNGNILALPARRDKAANAASFSLLIDILLLAWELTAEANQMTPRQQSTTMPNISLTNAYMH